MTIRPRVVLAVLLFACFFSTSCALLMRTDNHDKGVNLENVLFVRVDLPSSVYSQHHNSLNFAQQAISRIEVMPEVESAAVVDALPTSASYQSRTIYVEGAAASGLSLRYNAITSDYFQVLRIPLLAGRLFTDQDKPDSPGVIIISESVARNLFRSSDPLGKRISFSSAPKKNSWFTIVGVVGDVRYSGGAREEIYGAYCQEANSNVNIVVRARAHSQSIFEDVEKAVRAIDDQARVTDIPPR